MKLTYALHLDDYHANREDIVESKAEAVELVMQWITDGYDVDRVYLDGEPLQRDKPTYSEMVSALNPHWQNCSGCGGFHPVSSEC